MPLIKKDIVSCLSLANANKNTGNSIFFYDRKGMKIHLIEKNPLSIQTDKIDI